MSRNVIKALGKLLEIKESEFAKMNMGLIIDADDCVDIRIMKVRMSRLEREIHTIADEMDNKQRDRDTKLKEIKDLNTFIGVCDDEIDERELILNQFKNKIASRKKTDNTVEEERNNRIDKLVKMEEGKDVKGNMLRRHDILTKVLQQDISEKDALVIKQTIADLGEEILKILAIERQK